jgi:hypothetical protein
MSMIDLIAKVRTRKNYCFKIEEDDIPHQLKIDFPRNLRILHTSGAFNPYRFVVFWHKTSFGFMKFADVFLIDGTFNIVPSNFTQLVSFHGIICGKTYPLCFIILKTKLELVYTRAFEYVKDYTLIKPSYIKPILKQG